MDSILDSIKKLLGIDPSIEVFDVDLIIAINTAIDTLAQLGVGSLGGFSIDSNAQTWTDYLGDSKEKNMVKNFIHIKSKLLFDPPTSSVLAEAYNKQLDELTFRIRMITDPREEIIEDPGEEVTE